MDVVPTMDANITLLRRSPQLEPGSWWWPAGASAPVVSCPDCSRLIALGSGGMNPNGGYTPVVRCRTCESFMVVRLMGWGKP